MLLIHPVHSEDDQVRIKILKIIMHLLRCACFETFERHFEQGLFVDELGMSINSCQTGKLDLMRVGKMSVHQWINVLPH